jgi:hypothetical protein
LKIPSEKSCDYYFPDDIRCATAAGLEKPIQKKERECCNRRTWWTSQTEKSTHTFIFWEMDIAEVNLVAREYKPPSACLASCGFFAATCDPFHERLLLHQAKSLELSVYPASSFSEDAVLLPKKAGIWKIAMLSAIQ